VKNDEEEEQIVKYVLEIQNHGFPLSMDQLRTKIHEFTQTHVTPFKDGIPGHGWIRAFFSCHPQLSLRKPKALEQN